MCDNGNCIDPAARCDGVSDCGDLSDEISCGFPPCHGNRIYCAADDNCIQANSACDGTNDCSDGFDEECW